MKVLLVAEPGVDGVFRHVERLTHFLLARGHAVFLAYSTRRPSDRLYELVEELDRRGLPTIDLHVGNAPGLADPCALLKLLRFQQKHRADLIHGHSSKAGFLVRSLRVLGVGRPLLYTPHAYYRMNEPTGVKARFFLGCEKILGHIGDTVNVGRSESEFAHTLVGIRKERQISIRNGVDCQRFAPPTAEEKRRLRAEFGIPETAVVLGSVGRCSAQKDPLTMYRAAHRAREQHPELFFFHVGQGEHAADVDAFAAANGMSSWTRRLQYLSQPSAFYQVLDGFVLSSIYEGMSYATLEAIATGLPLILTRAPGNEDFAYYDLSHVFFGEMRDPETLSEAIVEWLGSLTRPSNHRDIALRRFDENICFTELLEAYERYVGKNGAAALDGHR